MFLLFTDVICSVERTQLKNNAPKKIVIRGGGKYLLSAYTFNNYFKKIFTILTHTLVFLKI